MKLIFSILIFLTIISLTLGTYGAWFFSTFKDLTRTLKDFFSMLSLSTGLIFAAIFLVTLLQKIENDVPNKNS